MSDQQLRIPRWLIENDPAWSKSFDSDPGILKWTKNGSNLVALCNPTSFYCNIIVEGSSSFPSPSFPSLNDESHHTHSYELRSSNDILNNLLAQNHGNSLAASDIRKYLSSRYLNPGTDGLSYFRFFSKR